MSQAVAVRAARPAPAAILELLKPITWFAPMWAFGCGVVSSSAAPLAHLPQVIAGLLLCGPLVCGTSQAANDWYDRAVDAINEPGRPIPSGRIGGRWGLYIALIGTAMSLLLAGALGPWGLAATAIGLVLAWAYSAPPVRLKQNGWWGNLACGACYEGLPWVTGVGVLSPAAPGWHVLIIAGLYSLGAHGIMTLNDFKSVDGDRQIGINSLPVLLGVERAAHLACWAMALPQIAVVLLLLGWGQITAGFVVSLALMAQWALMLRLLQQPRARAPWYNATGTSLYVLGMLACAIALRGGA